MRKYLCGEHSDDREAKTVLKSEDRVAYQMKNDAGVLVMAEYSVFPGIWLVYKDAHARKYRYPAAYPTGLREITHCREGR